MVFMASKYSYTINLDGQVDREPIRVPSPGTRALVYRGTMRSTGKKVSIKVFRAGPPTQEQSNERVVAEVIRWSKVYHMNIVQVFGVAAFDYKVSLVSKWMSMGNSIDYLKKQPIDPHPLVRHEAM
ncbi:hypothetical protein J3A83DRAFT_4213296 [Scleroderma citrinum]